MRKQRNRCFPDKAVTIWHQSYDRGHVRLVEEYLREAGNFENVRCAAWTAARALRSPLRRDRGEHGDRVSYDSASSTCRLPSWSTSQLPLRFRHRRGLAGGNF
jgi:hypothetical protein